MSEPTSKLFREDPAAYYTELGAQIERQRIIRLLIDKAIQSRLDLCDDEADVYDSAVALIKGEQK